MGLEISKTPEHLKNLLTTKPKSSKYFEVLDDRHLCETSGCFEKFPLHYACLRANLDEVQQLLGLIYYGSVDCRGRTPLICLASINRTEGDLRAIAEILINEASTTENLKLNFINAYDLQRRTALHYAAESEIPELVELLLEHGANPTETDLQGMSPLHCCAEGNSEEAIQCAKLLLNADDSSKNLPCKSTRHFIQKNSTPLHLAAAEKCWNMLKLLLERGCDLNIVDSEGRTPFHVAVIAGNCRNTVKCVELILTKCTIEQANLKTIERNETVLHLAAEFGHHLVLKSLLESEKIDIWALNNDKQTALHSAALCWFADKSLACVQALIESDLILENDIRKFTFARDCNCDTALHIACRRNFGKVAELFLTGPKPWRWLEDDLLTIVYQNVPNAMLFWMDKSFSYRTMDFKERKLSIEVDLTCITGYNDPLLIPQQETKYLHKTLNAKKWLRNKVLLHPLVQIFISKKWNRFRWLNWIGLFLQLSWLTVYTLFILEVFAVDCVQAITTAAEIKAGNMSSNAIHNGTQQNGTVTGSVQHLKLSSSNNSVNPASNNGTRMICHYNHSTVLILVSFLIPLSSIIVLKELFRIVEYEGVKRKLAKWIQWIVLFLIVFNLYPIFDSSNGSTAVEISSLQYAAAAIGIFLAWALSLREMSKIPRFGKYSEVLSKVSKNSFLMLLFYSPILIAFAIAFRILIPGKGQFVFMPVALVKILIMMTGEFEYEGIFYGSEDIPLPRVPVTAQLMFAVFVFMATIVLLNLLIGLAVQDPDVQNIIRDAEVNSLSSKLEQIFLMESFLLRLRRNLIGINSLGRFFSFINVTSQRIAKTSFYATKMVVEEEYFPEGFENEIHQLALGTKTTDLY